MLPVIRNETQRPKWRIGLAIALSLLVHYLMAGSWFSSGYGSHRENATRVQPMNGTPSGLSASLMPAVAYPATTMVSPEQPEKRSIADERNPGAVADLHSTITDDRYYSARELDRYPVPAAPLDFSRVVSRGTAGRVRMFVDIDHGGRVVALAAIEEEPPGRIQAALRDVLLRTLFTPGSKDGRAVNSRIMMEFRTP